MSLRDSFKSCRRADSNVEPVSRPAEFATSLDGAVFISDSSGDDAIRRLVDDAYGHVRPRLVVRAQGTGEDFW